jgi:hypothetical protein
MLMRSALRITVFTSVTALFALAVPRARCASTDVHWIADSKGCRIYQANPHRGETVAWSGDCANGNRYEGDFVAATLSEACYGDASELKSVDLVRSMGYPLQDEQAIAIVKVRSTDARILRSGGETCVGLGKQPARGCHMIGVLFTQGTYTTVSQGVQCTSSQG